MKCRHKNVNERVWRIGGGDIPTWFTCASFEKPDARACVDCGEWLSLGPSDDESPEVQVEIRAAYLAPHTTDVTEFTIAEWMGWNGDEEYLMCGQLRTVWDDMSEERFASWEAGVLAAAIAAHEETP